MECLEGWLLRSSNGYGAVCLTLAYPPPRGGISIFDSLDDFLKVHVLPHPDNKTIITFEDGEQQKYGNGWENESDKLNLLGRT